MAGNRVTVIGRGRRLSDALSPAMSVGLVTALNRAAVPSTALKQCINAVCKGGQLGPRPPLLQIDHGQASNGFAAAFGNCIGRSGQLGGYPYLLGRDGRIYAIGAGGSGHYSVLPADAGVAGFRGVPADMHGSHYLLGDNGLAKYTPGAAASYKAGAQRGLDLLLTATGVVGFLQVGFTAAYKIVWGYVDGNGFEVLGAPGGRYVVSAVGTNQNVTVKSPIPSEVPQLSSPFFQLYRAPQVNTGVPSEEYQLCFQAKVTATDRANGFIQFTDVTSDALLGALLYTNPSQETAAQENSQCPTAGQLVFWKQVGWAGNTAQRQEIEVSMLATPDTLALNGGQVQANTPVAGQATYTFAAAGTYDFSGIDNLNLLAAQGCTNAGNNGVFAVVSTNTAARQIVVTNAAAVNEVAPPAPAKAVCAAIEVKVLTTPPEAAIRFHAVWTEDIANQRYAVGASGSAGTDVLTTSQSLIRVINSTGPVGAVFNEVYAFDESSADSAPGQILFQQRSQSRPAFSVQAFGHKASSASGGPAIYANKFAPDLNVAIVSSAPGAINRVHRSKPQQPEAWPQEQFDDLGGGSAALLWIAAMRDSLLIFLEDGTYRVTTSDNVNFSFSLLSSSIVLVGTPAVYNDVCYLMSTQGVIAISDSGQVAPLDGAIRPTVMDYLAAFEDPQISSLAFTAGVGDQVFYAVKSRRVHVAASPMTRLVYFGIMAFSAAQQVPQACLVYSIDDGTWATVESDMTSSATIAATGNHNPVLFSPSFSIGGRLYWTSPQSDFSGGGMWTEAPRNVWQSLFRSNTVFGFEAPGDRHVVEVVGVAPVLSQITVDPTIAYLPAVGSVIMGTEGAGDSYTGGIGSAWSVTAVGAPDGFGHRTLTLAPYMVKPGDTVQGSGGFPFIGTALALTSAKATIEPYPFLGGDVNAEKHFSEVDAIMQSDATADAVGFEFYNERTLTNHDSAQTAVKLFSIRSGVPRRQQVCQRLSLIITHDQPLKFLIIEALSFVVEVTDAVPTA